MALGSISVSASMVTTISVVGVAEGASERGGFSAIDLCE